ncbi:MAG: cadherin-like domain-containing protein [Dechloromonas sp.]|uniref:Cadherin-like domain-containing protein n=1 Tax=Candidatus Dechloromonas phosphorivorans TaxID=2899244 RepID=A0A935JYK2_9RHOO|nr:cadherin-like domain-containing protein [Candidatus Dechloromonas phosphorivorans]
MGLDAQSNGSFSYTPAANYNGADSFVYAASDGVLTTEATVSLTIAAVNDRPLTVVDER